MVNAVIPMRLPYSNDVPFGDSANENLSDNARFLPSRQRQFLGRQTWELLAKSKWLDRKNNADCRVAGVGIENRALMSKPMMSMFYP